jgi:hypothetical protein
MKKLLVMFLILVGCATTQQPPSVCDNKPDSVICQVAAKVGQTPEQMAQVLKIANITALMNDVYTAQEAAAFVADLQAFVKTCRESQATYATVISYVVLRYNKLPPKVQIAFLLLQTVAGVQVEGLNDRPLTDDDYDMLEYHLNQQMQIITPFLFA